MDSTLGTAALTIKSGTLEFGKDVQIGVTAATSGATVTIGSGSTSAATLKLSKAQLEKALERPLKLLL